MIILIKAKIAKKLHLSSIITYKTQKKGYTIVHPLYHSLK